MPPATGAPLFSQPTASRKAQRQPDGAWSKWRGRQQGHARRHGCDAASKFGAMPAKKAGIARAASRCTLLAAVASSIGSRPWQCPQEHANQARCLLVLFLAAWDHRSDGRHRAIGRTAGFRSRSVLLGFLGHLLVALFFGHKYSRWCLEIRLVEAMVSDKSTRWNDSAPGVPRARRTRLRGRPNCRTLSPHACFKGAIRGAYRWASPA